MYYQYMKGHSYVCVSRLCEPSIVIVPKPEKTFDLYTKMEIVPKSHVRAAGYIGDGKVERQVQPRTFFYCVLRRERERERVLFVPLLSNEASFLVTVCTILEYITFIPVYGYSSIFLLKKHDNVNLKDIMMQQFVLDILPYKLHIYYSFST